MTSKLSAVSSGSIISPGSDSSTTQATSLLSDDCLSEILGYGSTADFLACTLVSRQWHMVTSQNHFWKQLFADKIAYRYPNYKLDLSLSIKAQCKRLELGRKNLASNHYTVVDCIEAHDMQIRRLLRFGDYLISVSKDDSLKIWDIESKACLQTIKFTDLVEQFKPKASEEVHRLIERCLWSPFQSSATIAKDQLILTISVLSHFTDGELKELQLINIIDLHTLQVEDQVSKFGSFSPIHYCKNELFIALDGQVDRVDLRTKQRALFYSLNLNQPIFDQPHRVYSMASHDKRNLLFAGTTVGSILVLDLDSSDLMACPEFEKSGFEGNPAIQGPTLYCDETRDRLIWADTHQEGARLFIWDIAKHKMIAEHLLKDVLVNEIRLTQIGNQLDFEFVRSYDPEYVSRDYKTSSLLRVDLETLKHHLIFKDQVINCPLSGSHPAELIVEKGNKIEFRDYSIEPKK